jgi:hypothetical protein
MIWFLFLCLSAGVLTGAVLVTRGGRENSLIGLNVATICAVTMLVAMDKYMGIAFSRDIALYLVLPGAFGVIVFSMALKGAGD